MADLSRLSNQPLRDTPTLSEDAQLLLDEIDALLSDERYNFAKATLVGIGDSIERTGSVSVNQHRAVENIRQSKQGGQRSEKRWGRRYEGR